MAPDRTRSVTQRAQLQLAATPINRDSRCAGPDRCKRRSVPEQFFNQRSFQHYGFGSYTNTDRYSYRYSNGNANADCYTNSDGYSFTHADDHAKAHSDAKASSFTAAEAVREFSSSDG
jgi:hypothetical protein